MNEFELAEIELMKKSYFIELETVTQGYVSLVETEASILLSLIFGYLLVAHFIGNILSRTQVVIFNALYMFTSLTSLSVYYGHYKSVVYSVERLLRENAISASDIPVTATTDSAKLVVFA